MEKHVVGVADMQMWEQGINLSKADPTWNAYDQDIQHIVSAYNSYLAKTPGYPSLDWRVIKAMLFVETGAKNKEWESVPMQAGNQNDVGVPA